MNNIIEVYILIFMIVISFIFCWLLFRGDKIRKKRADKLAKKYPQYFEMLNERWECEEQLQTEAEKLYREKNIIDTILEESPYWDKLTKMEKERILEEHRLNYRLIKHDVEMKTQAFNKKEWEIKEYVRKMNEPDIFADATLRGLGTKN